MLNKTNKSLADEALDELKNISKKTTAVADEQYDKINEQKEFLTEAAEKKLYQMGVSAKELACSAGHHASQYINDFETTVKKRPLLSIGVAALAGALLLKLLSRK